jgi:hypothetical protein
LPTTGGAPRTETYRQNCTQFYSKNNFIKGERDKFSAELAQQKEEIQVLKCGHIKHQADQLKERERDASILYKDFSRMKINFKNVQSTQAKMNKKLEYTHGLTPTYLAGLQETRGDIDRLAQKFDEILQEQKKKVHDARELMQKTMGTTLEGKSRRNGDPPQ